MHVAVRCGPIPQCWAPRQSFSIEPRGKRSYFVQGSLIIVIATTCRSRYPSLLDACSTCPSFVVFSFVSTAVAGPEPVSLTWRPTIGSNLMLLLRRDQIF